MATRLIHFRTEDKDLLDWYDSIPRNKRSEAVREALEDLRDKRAKRRQITHEDILGAIGQLRDWLEDKAISGKIVTAALDEPEQAKKNLDSIKDMLEKGEFD